MPYRVHTCKNCKTEWISPIIYKSYGSTEEKTVFCKCGRVPYRSTKPMDQDTIKDRNKKNERAKPIQMTLGNTEEGRLDSLLFGHTGDSVLDLISKEYSMAEPDKPLLTKEHDSWWFIVNDLFFDKDEKEYRRLFEIVLAETDGIEHIKFEEV